MIHVPTIKRSTDAVVVAAMVTGLLYGFQSLLLYLYPKQLYNKKFNFINKQI